MVHNKLMAKKNKMMVAMEKLQRSLYSKKLNHVDDSSTVPKDVKEGHFAVVAMDDNGGSARRFVVPLKYLTHPMFLALLERAAEEYGFDHRGSLTVPCHPSEMERILAQSWQL